MMQNECNERGYDMGMGWLEVEITDEKPILRENERARIIGFENVIEETRKMNGFEKKRSMDSNPSETDSNHWE